MNLDRCIGGAVGDLQLNPHDFRYLGVRYIDAPPRPGMTYRSRRYFHAYRCAGCLKVHMDPIPDGGREGWTDETTRYDALPAGAEERVAVIEQRERAARSAGGAS